MDIEQLINQIKSPQTKENVQIALYKTKLHKTKIETIYILYETGNGAFGFEAVGTPAQLKELAETGAKWMEQAQVAGFSYFYGAGKNPEENKEA